MSWSTDGSLAAFAERMFSVSAKSIGPAPLSRVLNHDGSRSDAYSNSLIAPHPPQKRSSNASKISASASAVVSR